ncbi:MAG TPA: cytochrome P450 [Pseudonocardiaceae bacterium]|jgi:cytochrome P450 monooxygenase OleP
MRFSAVPGTGENTGVVPDDSPLLFPFDTPRWQYPEPVHAELLAHDPVPTVRLASGQRARLATRFADVRTVLADNRFSRAEGAKPDAPTVVPGTNAPEMITSMDPPEHTRLRRLVSKAFTFRAVERLRPRCEQVVDGLLTRMARERPADIVTMLADPLPATMICEMLGVEVDDRQVFYRWLRAATAVVAAPPEEVEAATAQAAGYLFELFARRRAEPADDLVTALVQVNDEGDRLTEPELLMTVLTLFGAGQETTSNQLTKSLVLLLRHRNQWDLLVDKPDLVPGAVEELLRVVRLGPGAFTRVAVTDVELTGGRVAYGEAIFAVLNAANHDPTVFSDPDRIDVARDNASAHLSFGHGIHHCLGAPLARLELQLALHGLVTRFPALRLAVAESDLAWNTHTVAGGPITLPVVW